MKETICGNCKNWKETDFKHRFGNCSKFNKYTEWKAGILWQTRKRIKVCEGFSMK